MILIVPNLLNLLKLLSKFIFTLQCFLINKYMAHAPLENPVSEQYRKLQIDRIPIIETKETFDYKKLLADCLIKNSKIISPVNHRGKHLPPVGTVCPIMCEITIIEVVNNG